MSISANIRARITQKWKTKKKQDEALKLAKEINEANKTDQTLWDEIQQGMKKGDS